MSKFNKFKLMYFLIIFEIILLVFFVGALIYEYASKKVPKYVIPIVYISWLLSFGVIVLLPMDLYYV